MGSNNSDNPDETGTGRYELIDNLSEKHGIKREETAFGTNTIAAENNMLVCQNVLLEGTDFNLTYFPLKHLGYKLVIRSLAGIFASNGKPSALSVTIAMSSRFGQAQADELIEGISMAVKKYNSTIKFLDIISSVTGLTLMCTAWGHRTAASAIPSPPSVNDLICVTGDLGAAYTGLQILERERRIFESGADIQPDLSQYEYIIGRQLKPELKTDIIDELQESGVLFTGITVVRDGLASELIGFCKTHNKGCSIFYDKLPLDQETYKSAAEMNFDPVTASLNGGDDYEFLIFVPIKYVDIINKTIGLKMIGYLTDPGEGYSLTTPDNTVVQLRAQGWGDESYPEVITE